MSETVSQEDFAAYEEVRQSGAVNMLDPLVRALAGISRETHIAIIDQYKELCARWPDIRQLPSKE